MWDPATGQLLQVLEHARDVSAVAFTPNGQRFVAGDWKAIRVYPRETPVVRQDPARLLEEAQQQAGLWLQEFSLRPSRQAQGSP